MWWIYLVKQNAQTLLLSMQCLITNDTIMDRQENCMFSVTWYKKGGFSLSDSMKLVGHYRLETLKTN